MTEQETIQLIDDLIDAGLGDVPRERIPLDWRERMPEYETVGAFISAIDREWRRSGREEAYGGKTMATKERQYKQKLGALVMENAQKRRRKMRDARPVISPHRTMAERVEEKCARMKARMSQ